MLARPMRRCRSGPRPVRSLAAALFTLALCLAACKGEPSLLCDRVRVIWPAFNVDPSSDVSPAEGLQIDINLRSSVLPGSRAVLTVQGESGDPVAHPEPAIADADGNLGFSAVTVPLGRVTLQLQIENECGEVQSVREPFVWDGLGFPSCELDLGVEPAVVDELAPLRVLRAEHDADPDSPGIDLDVTVQAGRPDMTVSLFALDQATGEEQELTEETGDDLGAEFSLALPEGEHAVRAICLWPPAGLRPSSPTFGLLVDTVVPDCALVEPGDRVVEADDLDPGRDGVQFELLGRSGAEDVAGQPAWFAVQGSEIEGSAVDAEGESSAAASLSLDPPGAAQEISFRTRDVAGNECQDAVTFD
jgi:hypothetical protein